jgi:hypothetical protein
VAKGEYRIDRGTMDDLAELPTIRTEKALQPAQRGAEAKEGSRNQAVWEHCMRSVRWCDSLDALLDVANTFNGELMPPLAEAEVIKTAKSAWHYEQRGENRFSHRGAWLIIAWIPSCAA